jgi:hypothetical protein
MNAARTFRDLRVYQLARAASLEIFEASKSFPREEQFSLTDQVRRSSRATKAMISEAWGRRRYKAVFIGKIDEALGEATAFCLLPSAFCLLPSHFYLLPSDFQLPTSSIPCTR